MGTSRGYKIFNTKTFRMICEKNISAAVGRIMMLYKSNLLLLSGHSSIKSRFSHRSLIFWDDVTNESTGEVRFNQPILRLFMRKDL